MITIKELEWNNWFSFGDFKNKIKFDEPVIQLLGFNGVGKSSIPLILEEILYGKNSKGIKKADITNRYTDSDIREATLLFDIDGTEYSLHLRRTKTTTKLTLLDDGKDISSHTSTGTYKQVEKLIGLDFNTFVQLVYQSSKDSLEFLTATDAQRKRFLIGLLGLEKYSKIYEIYKDEVKEYNKLVAELEGVCSTIESWIESHTNKPLEEKELKENIIDEQEIESARKRVVQLEKELKDIHSINSKRTQNLQYKKMLDALDLSILSEDIQEPADISDALASKKAKALEKQNIIRKGKKLAELKSPTCPTCMQPVDKKLQDELLNKWREQVEEINKEIKQIESFITEQEEINRKYKKQKEVAEEFEKLKLLIDENLEDDLLNESELIAEIKELNKKINDSLKLAKEIEEYNKNAKAHNAKIEVIKNQIEEYKEQLSKEKEKFENTKKLATSYNILKQAFSTTGLVSYKIESLVKDLELTINEYLTEFSGGRFQLTFVLNGDKLNVSIIDNGKSISITALSSGELTRVNISTLLAIRKLMSSIAKTKINILFLDEVMGVLDLEGKNTLIDILLNEKNLNTVLVSHEYTHPLLEKIIVVKEGNIARLDHG